MANNKIYIFDTTLRDGEQVPGCKLNTAEKVDLALKLEELELIFLKRAFLFRALAISNLYKKYRR